MCSAGRQRDAESGGPTLGTRTCGRAVQAAARDSAKGERPRHSDRGQDGSPSNQRNPVAANYVPFGQSCVKGHGKPTLCNVGHKFIEVCSGDDMLTPDQLHTSDEKLKTVDFRIALPGFLLRH